LSTKGKGFFAFFLKKIEFLTLSVGAFLGYLSVLVSFNVEKVLFSYS